MNRFKKVMVLIVVTAMFLPVVLGAADTSGLVPSQSTYINEEKVYSTVTLQDDFRDDCVLVVLMNSDSLELKAYNSSSFQGVDCKEVVDLSEAASAAIAAQTSDTKNTGKASANTDNRDINPAIFHQLLCLKLANPGKENVLAAIKIIEQRPDVLYAGPNYIYTADLNDVTYSIKSVETSTPDTQSSLLSKRSTTNLIWSIIKIQLTDALDIRPASPPQVKVAFLDSGVCTTHPELSGRIYDAVNYLDTYVPPDWRVSDPRGHDYGCGNYWRTA